jgi:putative endonuclease
LPTVKINPTIAKVEKAIGKVSNFLVLVSEVTDNYSLITEKMANQEKGKKGEDLASRYLESKGYQIRERNFRFGRNEIDIIAQKEGVLIFVEVKLRTSTNFGFPEQMLKEAQKERIISAAQEYIFKIDWDDDIRFDIIAILQNKSIFEIEHFEDAFY